MRKLLFFILLCFCFATSIAQKDYTKLVNPFIGTGGHGHTYPGASMPFGMMQLSPDTRMADWDGSSGYHYSDSVIYGFSHTHLSGTGIPDYCDVLLSPFVGKVPWEPKEYRSSFSHTNEKASPGHYEVLLDKHGIKAELTTALRSGMHQYTFPEKETDGAILIDLKHRDEVLGSSLEKVSDYELRGLRRSKSWAQNQYLYFYIRFEAPIKEYGILKDDNELSKEARSEGKNIKAFVRFALDKQKQIRIKVGISGVSMDGAKRNVASEIPHWDFGIVRKAAQKEWNKELSKIDVQGGTKDQQTIFYTALYHTFLSPNIYQDIDGQFRGTDLKIHKAEGHTNYSVFSLWDTYRAYHPLMTIINQRRTLDWIKTFLAQYRYGGMLPVWELSGNETFCMIGYHSVPVITDAYKKGIRGFDEKLALEAMRSYAESNRFGLSQYIHQGYLSNEMEHESVSKTLEYAFDDWCIAQFAKATGNNNLYHNFLARAQNYKNVFDPHTKHMRGKVQGIWYQPFDPREVNNFYTEGNSWQYTFAVPQDIESLIQLYGGKESFAGKLNELFTTSSQMTGREQPDVTGLIGQYAHGNEPSHHMAYLFNYIGMPWRTQELIHKICTEFYKNSPDGLIGNEDCGQMSAWYILSAMGFYPVNPAQGDYVLGTPLFDEININLENGKVFTIKASRSDKEAKYIKGIEWQGKPHNASYIFHKDIINGGLLQFKLDTKPDKNWGTKSADLPRSVIEEDLIVPVPYFTASGNKFRDSSLISIKNIDSTVQIYYNIEKDKDSTKAQTHNKRTFVAYTQPFFIQNSSLIKAYALKGGKSSSIIPQQFYRIPNNYSITVLSKVHPMYTGGGQDALIDGAIGTTNWRTGEWHSYFDTDFEALIDLKETKDVSYVGVHVLQDISPWILYPKEVIFYASTDGKNYSEIKRIENKTVQTMAPAELQELGGTITGKARYIKVKALNGGKLPAWHESAGNPSHLFIDEIIIR